MHSYDSLIPRAVTEPALAPILAFDIISGVALVILLVSILVAWFSTLKRMKTWYLLLLSSAGYCLSFLLLVGQQTGPEPPLHFCAVSAALIYAAPPMVASAALFFVVDLHLRLSSVLFSRRLSDKFIYWVAWGIPLSHGVVFWIAMIIALSDTSKVKRDASGIYCNIDHRLPTLLTGTLVILFLGSMLVMEVCTVVHLVRQRAAIRNIRLRGSDFPLHLFIRTFTYTISGGLGIIMADVLINTSASTATVLLLAVIPLSIALVFGSQTDLLRALFLCQFRRGKSNKTQALPAIRDSEIPVIDIS